MAQVGNVLSIPRALRVFARATVPAFCAPADAVGNSVYISADAVGNTYTVRTADPSDPNKMPAVGILWKKPSATKCTVRLFGELKDICTGLTYGQPLYVGADSRPTHIRPTTGIVQFIGMAFSTNVIFIWPFGEGGAGSRLYQRPLSGARDGTNRLFTVIEKFLPDTIQLQHNGRILRRSLTGSVLDGDYCVLESGGIGAGYDSVLFLSFSPVEYSYLSADYDVSM